MGAIRIQHVALGTALAVISAGCCNWRPPVVVKVVRAINNTGTISSKDYELPREITEDTIDTSSVDPNIRLPAAFTVDFADSSINYKRLFWVRNPREAFGVGSDLRQAIWTAFDENGIGFPFPQSQVYPMEWPPSKEQTHRLSNPSNQVQAEAERDSARETP